MKRILAFSLLLSMLFVGCGESRVTSDIGSPETEHIYMTESSECESLRTIDTSSSTEASPKETEVTSPDTAPDDTVDTDTDIPSEPRRVSLRVGTYNIKTGYDVGYRMEEIAADILPLDLDIVGLQEVDIGTSRAGRLDTLRLLADASGYKYYAFSRSIYYQGGEYGTAILSRYPIMSYSTEMLPTPANMEQRSVGHAVIDIEGFMLDYFNTHLSFEDADVREGQLLYIADLLDECSVFILSADFNTENGEEYLLVQNSTRVNGGEYKTYNNEKALDDILLSLGWRVTEKGVYDSAGHSDHDLLWAEIECQI